MIKLLTAIANVTGIVLLSYSMSSSAVTIPTEKQPYFELNSSVDDKSTIFIGAVGDYLPFKADNNDVIIRAMMKQNVAANGHPKGEQYEYVVVANCDMQAIKIITVWHLPYEGATLVSAFPDLHVDDLAKAIVDAVNNSPAESVSPNTLIANVVDAGCKYINPPPPPEEKKPLEISI
jgi:hypothetical protein